MLGQYGEKIKDRGYIEERHESLRVRSQKEAITDWAHVMPSEISGFLRLFICGGVYLGKFI